MLRKAFYCGALLSLLLCAVFSEQVKSDSRAEAVSQFFGALDGNHDGQIDETEARKYIGENIGGADFNTEQKVNAALDHMKANVDGTDALSSISEAELEKHLRNLLKGASIIEWVKHGLGLPQYERAFRSNAITDRLIGYAHVALDLPLLVKDGEAILENDLKISSILHRSQITRGLKRLILGLGEHPGTPQGFQCLDVGCGKVSLYWSSPLSLGMPPLHKYVIERRADTPGAAWTAISEQEAKDSNHPQYQLTVPSPPGNFHYRIVAWSAYGQSSFAEVESCRAPLGTQQMFCAKNADDLASAQEVSGPAGSKSGVSMVREEGSGDSMSTFTGFSSVFVVLLTIAIRFLQSRHIGVMQCITFLGLGRLAGILRLFKLEVWFHSRRKAACDAGTSPSHTLPHSNPRENRELGPKQSISSISTSGTGSSSPFVDRSAVGPVGTGSGVHIPKSASLDSPRFKEQQRHSRVLVDEYGLEGGEYSGHVAWVNDRGGSWGEFHEQDAMGSWDSSADASDAVIDHPLNAHSDLENGRCAFEGCHRHWRGLKRLRKRLQRHFCGICQLTYCIEHTRISPHGSFRSCGQQSQCVCVNCFNLLPPERQQHLEKTNRLPQQSSKVTFDSDGGKSVRKSGSTANSAGRIGLAKFKSWGKGRSASDVTSLDNSASNGGGEETDEADLQLQELLSMRAQQNWARAGCKVRAVCGFRQAGRDHGARNGRH